MEQQKIRFAPGDRVQRTKSNGKKAHVGAQGTVSAILKSGNLRVRADGQPLADCVWKPENVERIQPLRGRELHEKLNEHALALQGAYGASYVEAYYRVQEFYQRAAKYAVADAQIMSRLYGAHTLGKMGASGGDPSGFDSVSTFERPKPEVCAHATAQMLTEWPNAGEGYARDCFDLRKAQQDAEIRAHYTRNLREWPLCPHGGKVEIVLWGTTDTNARGPMRYTYGLCCRSCRDKTLPKPDNWKKIL